MERKLIGEGKTKRIYRLEDNDAEIENIEQITAGDGEKKDFLAGKDIIANNTTCNIFELLRVMRIGTHYKGRMSDKSFRAIECKMIPLEVVIRRIATGSYLKRHPEVKEGTIFDPPEVEFFHKDDKLHDPFIVRKGPYWERYYPKKPTVCENYIDEIKALCAEEEARSIEKTAREVFLVIESAFRNVEIPVKLKDLTRAPITLKDLKIEFGRDFYGQLIVADVIDNDSWRIEDANGVELSKEGYRQGLDLETVKNHYEIVSEITNAFKNLNQKTALIIGGLFFVLFFFLICSLIFSFL